MPEWLEPFDSRQENDSISKHKSYDLPIHITARAVKYSNIYLFLFIDFFFIFNFAQNITFRRIHASYLQTWARSLLETIWLLF